MDETTAQIVNEAETFLVAKRTTKLAQQQVANLFARLEADKKLTSSFLVCLIARLISLNSVHAYKRLGVVVDELLGDFRFVDEDGYGQWVGKAASPLDESVKEIVEPLRFLQSAILRTIDYLTCFFEWDSGFGSLRVILEEWDVATAASSRESELEQKVLNRISTREKNDDGIEKRLGDITKGFSVGQLINIGDKATARSQPICDPFLYYQLLWRSGEKNCIDVIIEFLINQLSGEELEFDQNEENLLPLLQLFVEVASTAHYVDPSRYFDAYRAIQSYYLWPQPYCAFARDVLDFIRIETRCPGHHFRQRMIVENSALGFLNKTTRDQQIHVLVDQSCSEASALLNALQRSPLSETKLKKAYIKRLFCSFYGPGDKLTELHQHLEVITSQSFLQQICIEAESASEEAVQQHSEEKARDTLAERLETITTTIQKHVAEQEKSTTTSTSETFPVTYPPSFNSHAFDSETATSSSLKIICKILRDQFDWNRAPPPPSLPLSPPVAVAETERTSSGTSTDSGNDAVPPPENGINARNDSTISRTSVDSAMATEDRVPELPSFLALSPRFPSRAKTRSFSEPVVTPPPSVAVAKAAENLRRYYGRGASLPGDASERRDELDAMRLRSPKMARHHNVFSALRKPSFNLCEVGKPLLIKIVVLGDDRSVKNVADCYGSLRKLHPSLMQEVEMRFYYIPVVGQRLDSSSVWLAKFLSHFDGWYGRLTVDAMANSHGILPLIDGEGEEDGESVITSTPSPRMFLHGAIAHFCHHAHYELFFRLYEVKIARFGENSPSTHTMLQRIEILPAGQQRNPREFVETTTKPQNLCINASLVTVDGHVHETIAITDKLFWSITLSNVLRPGDSCIANPEMIGFELTLIEAATVQQVLRATKYAPKDETREMLHVNEVIVSASNSMTSLRIRLDDADPMEVQRLEVRPLMGAAMRRPSFVLPTAPLTPSDDGSREEVAFSLMTYWPVTM